MDFYTNCVREIEKGPKKGQFEIYPDFTVGRSKDLMVRGKGFYAIWDEEQGMWSTDEYDVQRLVDADLRKYKEEMEARNGGIYVVRDLRSFSTNGWTQFRKFMQNISDNSHQLDQTLTFANQEVTREDHVSRRLPYPLAPGDHSAWDELVGTLYSPEERAKIEWTIGAIISGDSKKIQKFLVFYGPGGTGKSTIMEIMQKLFVGYYMVFEAKALVGNNNAFSTEAFKSNPLLALQHDGDLSKIEDNSKLNSIVAHEEMLINEKYKPGYMSHINAFLVMGTNKPVKITDAKSGIIRRLIDVQPTGEKIPKPHYVALMQRIDFELGAIAHHCLETYREMGKNYYEDYRPMEMMLQTDVFFNYIESHFDVFKQQDGVSLKQAYTLYKEWATDTGIEYTMPQYRMREELKNYFDEFHDRITIDGVQVRSWFSGFNAKQFKAPADPKDAETFKLVLDETTSLLDAELVNMPAQYANEREWPKRKWENVDTTLFDINTHELHYVKVPENMIVIDFDLKDDDGNKSLEKNLEAASLWPATYAELSKGGEGVHLHYNYDGPNIEELASAYSEGIEVKTLLGNSALRRRLSKCNNVPVATISSGLAFKEKKVLTDQFIKSEKGLRAQIERNLRKEIHPGTKPSVDFIKKILDDAYAQGLAYDVSDLRPTIIAFANNSSNQPLEALKTVQKMRFKSEEASRQMAEDAGFAKSGDDRIVFYDIEVYPNLFVVCWKYEGSSTIVRMINPTPQEIEGLLKLKLIGFNNRRYDNHILYARFMGYDNESLYKLSQMIINNNPSAMFGEAYNLSFADIYDFSSIKQSLKKFEIELGILHMELDIPWDQPVPEELWDKIVEYCCNDVVATEATFEDRKQDFVARQILAALSGLRVNDTTAKHTAKIIFGNDKNAQAQFVYTDLSEMFPGYKYEFGKSTYMGEEVGEGGLVRAKPGIYHDVALLDVASMHPTSIELLNLFGPYTQNYSDLKAARIAIKRGEFDKARGMLGGRLAPFLEDTSGAEALSYALKIVINIVYGLTSAKFDNPFRDRRNIDNIVAKRGALFMMDLKKFVEDQGFVVAHIKTDSIKIPNATPEIIKAVTEFGAKYGYEFEHEATYKKMALVNDAVYIAQYDETHPKKPLKWEATGAQFQHPYVYKKLFSKEPITFDDLCETKQVSGQMYLDFDWDRAEALKKPGVEDMHFVGRIGRFIPVQEGYGGGVLYRVAADKNTGEMKKHAVTGTKNYLWVEDVIARTLSEDVINMSYYDALVEDAIKTINKFGDFYDFVGGPNPAVAEAEQILQQEEVAA